MLVILLYIAFRFEFGFGIGAMVATLHDILMTIGIFVLFGHQFSAPMVAAILCIAGYSINDTVVVFDRIREELKLNPTARCATSSTARSTQGLRPHDHDGDDHLPRGAVALPLRRRRAHATSRSPSSSASSPAPSPRSSSPPRSSTGGTRATGSTSRRTTTSRRSTSGPAPARRRNKGFAASGSGRTRQSLAIGPDPASDSHESGDPETLASMRWTYTPLPAERSRRSAAQRGRQPRAGGAAAAQRPGRDRRPRAKFLRPRWPAGRSVPAAQPRGRGRHALRAAIARTREIVVLGDYDVDGVSSTALLVSVCGASASIRASSCRAARGWLRPVAQRDRPRARGRQAGPVHRARLRHELPRRGRLPARQGVDVIVSTTTARRSARSSGHADQPARARRRTTPMPGATSARSGLVFKLAHGLLKQLRAETIPWRTSPQAARLPRPRGAGHRRRSRAADSARTASSRGTGLRILQETRGPGLRR
jgi:hypothetical protein